MSYRSYDTGSGGGFDPMSRMMRSSAVRALIFINVGVYILELLARLAGRFDFVLGLFGMVPILITTKFFVWQFLTATFLHSDFFHILFNMLGIFFFGPDLEWAWGRNRFLGAYLGIGILANVFAYLLDIHAASVTLGASGAVFGILGAYAAMYPNRQLIFLIFPIKAKWLVLFYFIFSLLGTTGLEGYGGTAYAVHLAGIVLGVAYVKLRWEPLVSFTRNIGPRIRLWYLRRRYKNWQVIDDRREKRWDDYQN